MSFISAYGKKILYFLATGATSLLIAACYGMPAGFRTGTWTIRAHDGDNRPIKGIEVKVVEYNTDDRSDADTVWVAQTDSEGNVRASLEYFDLNHLALLHDVDGEENGGTFSDTTVVKPEDCEAPEITIVRMRPAQ